MSQPVMVSGVIEPGSTPGHRWLYLDHVRRSAGPFVTEEFNGSPEAISLVEKMKVLYERPP